MTSLALPWPARLLAISLALGIVFLIGQLRGERIAGQRHLDYVTAQASQTTKIVRAQAKVVIETQVKYVDRIKTIYKQGETIEKQVPIYVTAADDSRCSISTGFVRAYDAAWSGDDPGPAASADREPAAVSLATVAETNAANATSCRAWREQAIGLRELYSKLQKAMVVK
ncbi:hypothetical protein [Undibacterium curvum]|uniref:hypothetical protein n=1 Tax=Undibacterium curvum TaxID=2762294 RepID=UPI003D0ED881